MSVVLWPRQEVLQLVVPQFSTAGRSLTPSMILEVVRKLLPLRNQDGKIR